MGGLATSISDYGDNNAWASMLGIFDAFWAISYMAMAAGLCVMPLTNAYYMSLQDSADNGFTHLTYGVVQAIGILGSYAMLENTT